MKQIRCPRCQSFLKIGRDYFHDESLNVRCKKCKHVIFATNETDEKELLSLVCKPISEVTFPKQADTIGFNHQQNNAAWVHAYFE